MTPFGWVHKRDGRLVPFDADKISRALFAASENVGQPDAFMARELTDSVLHFLSQEVTDPPPSTAQIAELVIKVVRELGQPLLARAYADAQSRKAESGKQAEEEQRLTAKWKDSGGGWDTGSAGHSAPFTGLSLLTAQMARWVETVPAPAELSRRTAGVCFREYSLREVFARDLVAAQADGLLALDGLEAPFELGALVLAAPLPGGGMVEALEEARTLAGEYVAIDGPEYLLARRGAEPGTVDRFVRELGIGLRMSHLQAVLNLNCATPPPWAEELAVGPLFAGYRESTQPDYLAGLRDGLLEQLAVPGALGGRMRVDWHLGEGDFTPAARPKLLRLARQALEGAPLAFVFDRPRRDLALAEGLDRRHPGVLITVGLHLPRLLEQTKAGIDQATFLQKLGSLARLALSAATQKREFLRRHAQARPSAYRGFLLDRACLVIAPIGLEAATQTLLGRSVGSGGGAQEFARQVVEQLDTVLSQDAQAHLLNARVDSALGFRMPGFAAGAEDPADAPTPWPVADGRWPTARNVAGLTAWIPDGSAKQLLQWAGVLHGVAKRGTAALPLTEQRALSAEEIADLLNLAWQQTEVVRIRFLRSVPKQKQLIAT